MITIIKVSLMFCIIVATFFLYGTALIGKLKIDGSIALNTLSGTFLFFLLFSLLCTPCVFAKITFTFVYRIWLIFWALSLGLCICYLHNKGTVLTELFSKSLYIPYFLLCSAMFIFFFYYAVTTEYFGWDTSYYVKITSNAVNLDSMVFEWKLAGSFINKVMPAKYAMGAYFIFLAVPTRLLGCSAILVCRFIGGGLCILLSCMAIYRLAEEIFQNSRRSFLLTCIWIILNLYYVSLYTSSLFLILRSNEGKAWCCNVIIPFILLLFYHLYKHHEDKGWWGLAFITAASCNSISMSMILMAPIMYTILSFFVFVRERGVKVIRNWIICMIPLGVYMGIYLVTSKGWLIIRY